MKLYMVHCGYYDELVSGGLFESHTNLFVVAKDFSDAKTKIKSNIEFNAKKMHIDGLVEIIKVDGYKLVLENDTDGKTIIENFKHRDLKPVK